MKLNRVCASLALAVTLALSGVASPPAQAAVKTVKTTVKYTDFKWSRANTWTIDAETLAEFKSFVAGEDDFYGDLAVRFGTAKVSAKAAGAYSFGVEKNQPKVNIVLGGETVQATCDDLWLSNVNVRKKATKNSLLCHLAFSQANLLKFITAVVSLPDKGTIVYTFKTPKLSTSAKVKLNSKRINKVTYKGVSAFSNKAIRVTETVDLP